MKLLHVICVVAAACAAATNVHALDGGPASGGNLSVNPNNRTPRTESTADGGPMSGTSSSINPNAPRPSASADAGPMSGTSSSTNPNAPRPSASADAGPPMSGGDLSTNPTLRTRTPSPAPTPTPTTATPAVTTSTPILTSASPVPAATTKAPSPSTITEKPPATITEKPPATITDKPSATPAPSSNKDGSAAGADEPSPPTPHETEVLDFSIINSDKSGGRDVVGEVSTDRREESVNIVPSDEVAGEADLDAIKEETDAPAQSDVAAATLTAVKPSPISKNTKSNTMAASSAPRATIAVAAATVATLATSMMAL